MSVSVFIGGVQITGTTKNIALDSVNVDMRIGSRSTAQCKVQCFDLSYIPAVGAELKIYEGATQIFGGLIQRVVSSRVAGSSLLYSDVTASDYRALADRRLTGERFGTSGYYNAKAGDIFRDLVTNCLGGDGVSLTYVPAGSGPVIERLELDYAKLSDAFDQLCELAGGYAWNIDEGKNAQFYLPTSGSTVLVIQTNSSNPLANTLSVESTLEQYSNKIVVKFGSATSAASETFNSTSSQPTDGSRQEWTLQSRVFSEPAILVNGTAKTLGVNGVDTGKDWYWSPSSAQIAQAAAGTPLSSGDTLEINYTAVDSLQVFAENSGQIAARAAIESTAGIWEALYTVDTATATSDAQAVANSIRDRYDAVSYRLKCDVRSLAGIKPGDRVRQLLSYLPTGYFVISTVRFYSTMQDVRRQIEAIQGPILQDGFQAFKQLTGTASGSGSSVSSSSGGSSTPDALYTISWASSITPNASNGSFQAVTIGGATTINAPTGFADGESITLTLIQGGTPYAVALSGWGRVDGSEIVQAAGSRFTITARFGPSGIVATNFTNHF